MNKILLSMTGLLALVISVVLIQDRDGVDESLEKYQKLVVEPKKNRVKKYDRPKAAAEWWGSQLKSRSGENPAHLNMQHTRSILKQEQLQKSQLSLTHGNSSISQADEGIPNFAFENIGSGIFGGRIRAFVIKPDAPGVLLAGSVSGGIWKSVNDGKSWQPKTDFLPNIAIGSLVVDPDNSNRVFAGTGEGFFNLDLAQGAGIFVSEDFGETWSQLNSTLNNNFAFVNRLAMIPGTDIIMAATNTGIFRSTNLGNSWQEVSGYFASGRGFVDLKVDPSNPNHVLAVHYGSSNDAISFKVNSPTSVQGAYNAVAAGFGPGFDDMGVAGNLAVVDDGTDTASDGCETILNNIGGRIALIPRGGCNFVNKVKNAENAGAIAVVIYQSVDEPPFAMGGEDDSINIPSIMVGQSVGESLADVLSSQDVNVLINLVPSDNLGRFVTRSMDAGQSWTVLIDAGLPLTNVGRMELEFGQDGVIYVAAVNSDDKTRGLWRSPGNTAHFVKTQSDTEFVLRQGWYDLALGVKPDNSDVVFVGAIDAFKSSNRGNQITQTSFWAPQAGQMKQFVHADHHDYIFDLQNPNHMYLVTDGGVYKTTDNGANFVSLNNGLGISQSYGIAVHPNGQYLTSGTQDNGSQLYFGDSNIWLEWRGGDGGYSAWDRQSPNYVYGSNPRGDLFGSRDGGQNIVEINLPDTDGSAFIQPFVLNPYDGNQMLAGTDNVFYSSNIHELDNATWIDVSSGVDFNRVSTLTFSPMINGQAFAGGENGSIYRIDNLGISATTTDIGIKPSNGARDDIDFITDIVVDPSDTSGQTIYVTMAFYDAHRIYKTVNGGASWQSIAGNLPNIPLFRVAIDPINPNRLYVGSELGLWTTDSTGSGDSYQWSRYQYGTAFTRIVDLVWSDNNTLYVGTHGRGVYRAERNPLTVSVNKFVTTNSSCDRDNILDVGEQGLLLLDIVNEGGAAVSGFNARLENNNLIDVGSFSIDIPRIEANQTVSIAFPVSLPLSSSACLTQESLTVVLTSSGESYSTDIVLPVGTNIEQSKGDFYDGGESNTESQLTTKVSLGQQGWEIVTDVVNSGGGSWFISSEPNYSDKSLISPWLIMADGGNVLEFSMRYNTEGDSVQYWDGVVLELRTEDTDWQDIGQFSTIPYDGLLYDNNTAPGRPAWSGSQLQWRDAMVDLGDKYLGEKVQFRFRMVSDASVAEDGFWLDDVKMSHVYYQEIISCDVCQSEDNAVPFSGLWFDPARLGQGFFVEPMPDSEAYFGTFYTRDDEGQPEWYVFSSEITDGILNANMSPGTLQRYLYDLNAGSSVGNASFPDPATLQGKIKIDFDTARAANNELCLDGAPGRDLATSAIMTYEIEGQVASWCIQPMISETNKASRDLSGIWFSGLQDGGWGFSIVMSKDQLLVGLYYYDAAGKPRWAIGQAGSYSDGEEIVVNMTEASAPGFDRNDLSANPELVNNGVLTIRLNNATGILAIDGEASFNVEYQGPAGGRWIREDLPITIFTQSHE